LFSDSWLESSAFSHFIEKVQQLTKPSAKSAPGISILLDAENLKLDINTETFLARLCKYPLKSRLLLPTGKTQHWQAGCRTL